MFLQHMTKSFTEHRSTGQRQKYTTYSDTLCCQIVTCHFVWFSSFKRSGLGWHELVRGQRESQDVREWRATDGYTHQLLVRLWWTMNDNPRTREGLWFSFAFCLFAKLNELKPNGELTWEQDWAKLDQSRSGVDGSAGNERGREVVVCYTRVCVN